MSVKGRAWKYGDNIDTDQLAPIHSYRGDNPEDGYVYCLETVDPGFAKSVNQGDVFVAGANLGIGSSREWAPFFLNKCGIRAVLAKSFARIFYRNCFNLGLPALVCADADRIAMGDDVEVDLEKGEVRNLTKGEAYPCDPVPPHLMEMVADGGLMPHLKKRLRA